MTKFSVKYHSLKNKRNIHKHTVLPPFANPGQSEVPFLKKRNRNLMFSWAGSHTYSCLDSPSLPCLARLPLLFQNCMAPSYGGLVGALLHPFKPCGQDPCMATTCCFSSPSQAPWLRAPTWLREQWLTST